MPFLQVENLKKSFGATEVLRGVSFGLEKGKVLAIIGSSGGGKTTLLRCLNFLETADEGKITVDGEILFDAGLDKSKNRFKHNASLRDKRLHFGLIFQNFNLFPHCDALKNVTIAANILAKRRLAEEYKAIKAQNKGDFKKIRALKRSAKETLLNSVDKNARDLLARVGLEDKIHSYPCNLSGGQCQRVAIARALALSPDVLCFDEPTSALDPELTGEVLSVIKGLKDDGRTMIIVTHEMEFAKNVADEVMFVSDGEIAEIGPPEQIFCNPQNEKTKNFLACGNFDY